MEKPLLKRLFSEPTTQPFIQFFRYVFVGGCSFLVDAGVLWLCVHAGLHYLVGACFGFVAGLVCNFLLSRALVFRAQEALPEELHRPGEQPQSREAEKLALERHKEFVHGR